MDTLPLSISADEYARIKEAEAVVITTYSGPDGRFTKLRFIGSREEAEIIASTPQLVIVPNGIECGGCEVVNCADLIPPPQEDIDEMRRETDRDTLNWLNEGT